MITYNRGNLIEIIIVCAIAARFNKRLNTLTTKLKSSPVVFGSLPPVNIQDVKEVLSSLIANNTTLVVYDTDPETKSTVYVTDSIAIYTSFTQLSQMFLYQKENWTKLSNIFLFAISKVNSDYKLNAAAYKAQFNMSNDYIIISSNSANLYKTSSIDVSVVIKGQKELRTRSKNTIKLKYTSSQLNQSLTINTLYFAGIFSSLNIPTDYSQIFDGQMLKVKPNLLSYNFSSISSISESNEIKSIFSSLRIVYKQIAYIMNNNFRLPNYKQIFVNFCNFVSRENNSGYNGISFYTKGSISIDNLDSKFLALLGDTQFEAVYVDNPRSPMIKIYEKNKRGEQNILLTFKCKVENTSLGTGSYQFRLITYVNSGPLFYSLSESKIVEETVKETINSFTPQSQPQDEEYLFVEYRTYFDMLMRERIDNSSTYFESNKYNMIRTYGLTYISQNRNLIMIKLRMKLLQ